MEPMHLSLLVLLCPLVCCVAASDDPCRRNESTDIHIIGFFPCTASNDTRSIPVDNCDGIDRIPIMRLALEEINERCDLLPGYRLVVDYANSACLNIPTPAVYHLIQQTDPSQPTKLMILGPACSVANTVMGEIAERRLNITQVSYTASSSIFENKTRYPRFYRLIPLAQEFANGYAALIKDQRWQKVAVISTIDDFTKGLKEHTVKVLKNTSIDVVLDTCFANDENELELITDQIKQVNARIIIAWISPSATDYFRKFWCKSDNMATCSTKYFGGGLITEAIRSKLTGPNFVWLFPGWFKPDWLNDTDTQCDPEEMKNALRHSLGVRGNSELTSNQSRILVSNKKVSQYENDLLKYPENVETDVDLRVGYVYDAMWTIALALNASISILEDRGLGRLEDFTYDSVEMANVFKEAVANVSFEGISGRVTFKNNGNRNNPSLQIFQYRDADDKHQDGIYPVKLFDPSEANGLLIDLPNETLKWQNGTKPRDGPTPVVITNSLTEHVIVGVVSSIGILSALFFLAFNIYFNNNVVVKRSSYQLNSLILIAVLVGFVGTLLHVIKLDDDMAEPLTTTICNARNWTSHLAFVLAFGTLFTKVWRLYKLFFNKNLTQYKYLSDTYLFLMVVVIASPTLLLLIIQAAAFPLTWKSSTISNKGDISTEEIYSECRGKHEFVFVPIYYATNGLLAVVSVLVAFQTQKHVPKFGKYHKYHESAVINLTTILAVLLSSVCQVVVIVFRISQVQDGVLLVITLRDCLWMFPMIYLLFIPKVYRVFRHSPQQMRRISVTSLVYTSTTMFSRRSLRRSTITEDKSPTEKVLIEEDNSSSDARRKSVDQIDELAESPNHLVQTTETAFPFWMYYKTTAV